MKGFSFERSPNLYRISLGRHQRHGFFQRRYAPILEAAEFCTIQAANVAFGFSPKYIFGDISFPHQTRGIVDHD